MSKIRNIYYTFGAKFSKHKEVSGLKKPVIFFPAIQAHEDVFLVQNAFNLILFLRFILKQMQKWKDHHRHLNIPMKYSTPTEEFNFTKEYQINHFLL